MEAFYITIVAILFLLAISDLIIGVSNDAVNFLNSAIGSKAASIRVIFAVATLGILLGVLFSTGMMEVARKGIFNPQSFNFSEIMIIFLAVMISDVILLDLFNTFGLPTSTTVSLVFELLGASVAISIFKMAQSPEMGNLSTYINAGNTLGIITGILLSVGLAFTFGAIIQYIVRFAFTFNFSKTYRYFGSIWGSIAITSIIFFLLINGAKHSSIVTPDQYKWMQEHTWTIIMYSLLFWLVILQLSIWLFKANVLKFVVLVGTFSLAMAFAGNDLVNFIGVPLAGMSSYNSFIASGVSNPESFNMISLTEKVATPTNLLLLAGIIMAITLWTSKKARAVTRTTLDLSRQGDGDERFQTSLLARAIVRTSIKTGKKIDKFIPRRVSVWVDSRFDEQKAKLNANHDGAVSFDLIRASVNLMVASILIAMATSLKLPLSTTYVTFMVAMGTSFADRAWGRESAVYRVSGVITVISGWFFTAFSAFIFAFAIAMFIHWGGMIAILIMVAITIFIIIRTHILFKNKEIERNKNKALSDNDASNTSIIINCKANIYDVLSQTSSLYYETFNGLTIEKRSALKKIYVEVNKLDKQAKAYKNNIHYTLSQFDLDSLEASHYYVQIIDYLRETTHCLSYIINPIFNHVDNNHKPMGEKQLEELEKLNNDMKLFLGTVINIHQNDKFDEINDLIKMQQSIIEYIGKIKKNQLKRIKSKSVGTKNSILFLDIINESKNLLLNVVNLIKAERDFISHQKQSLNN